MTEADIINHRASCFAARARRALPVALCLAIAAMVTPASAQSAPPGQGRYDDDALTRMFRWWNGAFKEPDGFTEEAFARYFTPDAVMRINGTDRARGIAALTERFRMIRATVDKVEIVLPLLIDASSPDGKRIFTYHLERSEKDGKPEQSVVSGYVDLRDGKIALINFVSIERPADFVTPH